MIGYLKGSLKHLSLEEKLVLVGPSLEGQVGYLIHVPQTSMLTVAPEGSLYLQPGER